MRLRNPVPSRRQAGLVTLVISLVMLLAMTLFVILMARSSLVEVKASANSYRDKQAMEAAETGMNTAVAYYTHGSIDRDGDGTADPVFDTNNDGIGDANTVTLDGKQVTARFCTVASNPPTSCTTPTTDLVNVMLFSQGWSDDQVATHRVAQVMTKFQALPNGPSVPFVGKVINSMTGTLNVTNNETNTTIWTGDNIQSASGNFKTEIQINGVNDQISSEKNGSVFTLGTDIVQNDQSLKNATPDTFFQNFFGRSRTAMKAAADTLVTSGSLSAGLHEGELIYMDTGSTVTINQNLGSPTNPVILIVNGALKLHGDVYGVVYCKDLDAANGNGSITGSMIAENVIKANGTFDYIYSGNVMTLTQGIGKQGPLNGSWRDF